MSGPLDGLSIIDLSQGVAGALATMLLGDNGARIVKVEPPGGDSFRVLPPLRVWNRGKKSITLDLGKPQAKDVLFRLLYDADVLLETYQPGVTARLGIDYPSLRDRYSKLIYCSLTGYGQEGSEKDRPAYDGLVQARTGLQWLQEGHRDGPIYLGFAIPSYSAGFMASYGILAALHARAKTGQGQHVDTSLRNGTIMMQRWGWSEPVPDAPEPGGRLMMTRVFQCGDGEYLWTHTGARGSFERLMRALGLTEFIAERTGTQGARMDTITTREVAAQLNKRAEEVFASKTRAEWMDHLDGYDIPNRPSQYPGEAFDDEQVNIIGAITDVEDPELGTLREIAPPYRFELTPHGQPGPAPRPGEHTDTVLEGLGFSQEEIRSFRDQGVVG